MIDGLIYLLRCPISRVDALLASPGVLRSVKPHFETQKSREHHGARISNGTALVRVVMDRPAPADGGGATWRKLGSTALVSSPTFTPDERCKRGHPPLRYLTNNGCVYCVKGAPGETTTRLRLQVPTEALEGLEPALFALGWKMAPGKLRESHGRRLVAVDAPCARAEAITLARAMGWEVALW